MKPQVNRKFEKMRKKFATIAFVPKAWYNIKNETAIRRKLT